MERGGLAVGVSLDISNAFNSLPWRAIHGGLRRLEIPDYLVAVVGSFLRGRTVSYRTGDGELVEREMFCGVPQGSVLGPLLWCVGYDAVLATPLPEG